MMIYQAKNKAVIMDAYRWALVQRGDYKIKWINKFSGMVEALATIGYYQLDSSKNIIRDVKGLPVFAHDWEEQVEIHGNTEQLKNDLQLSCEL